jgi:signal transduction histidine kinase
LRTDLAWAAAFIASVVVGRMTFDNDLQISLFWPAAGVGAIWILLSESAPALVGRLVFIYVTSVVTGLVTGFELSRVSLSAFGAVALPVLVRAGYCAAHRTPLAQLPVVGLRRPRDLVELVVIATVASTLSSGLTELLRAGSVGITLEAFVAMTARNAVAIIVIGGALLAIRDRIRDRRSPDASTQPSSLQGRYVELTMLLLASAAIIALIFTQGDTSPVGFTSLLVVAWVGYRFDPLVVSIYNLLFTVCVVLLTQAGLGPFAVLDDHWEGAALVQFFAAVTSMVSLMLSLGVSERRELELVLADHEAQDRVRRERTRLAREVNDTIVQALVAAETALDLQLPGQARHSIGEASQQARDWIGELYGEEEVFPGAAVRREPAKLETGRVDG